ncbi:MAG TPA: hypothetical protein VE642_02850 [Pyrinomonadaceae bacterium]|nr:hypothetical protein [Pyrinomonadaceae bacterium]
MTNEEMEKAIKFIVSQQAQFAVDIQQLRESQARTDGTVGQLTGVVAHLAAETRAGSEEVRGGISALVDAQIRTDENVRQLGEEVRNLTAVVDRYFRGRNGQTGSE